MLTENAQIRAYIEPVSFLKKKDYRDLIQLAINEDSIKKDITTNAIFRQKKLIKASLLSKQKGVLCGTDLFLETFRMVDKLIRVKFFFLDGNEIKPKDIVAEISGNVQTVLRAERIALNFLSMMSGIAGKTRTAAMLLEKSGIIPLDTRKTIPGYRKLSKYAVYIGGGSNHRVNLQQMGLIKDNHIAALGGVKNAIQRFRKFYPTHKCEVEVENIQQLHEALNERPDMILLDNMSSVLLKKCAGIIRAYNKQNQTCITSEASGGFHIHNLKTIISTGVDFVSMGSLTNNIQPHDFSLEFENL